jgi:hypothetical protein
MQRIIQCEHRVRKQNSYVMFLRKSLRQVDLFLKMPSCDVQKKKKKGGEVHDYSQRAKIRAQGAPWVVSCKARRL